MTIFIELSLIIVIATLCAFLARLLRQPLLVGYVATGVLIGPYALNLLHSTETIELFSKIGIAILLFIVGLSLNPDIVREVGKSSLVVGLGQVIFTSLIGYLIMILLGFSQVEAVYGAVALTFSSTIIILKLLADKGDLGKLHGKIAVGMLLVQDLIATFVLVAVSLISSATGAVGQVYIQMFGLLAWGAVAGLALYLISKFILPFLSSVFAGSQELLFIFSLAWGLGLSALFHAMGYSIEIGALIAGVTLAASPFAYEIGSRLKPLRDFFIILFFILLGAQIVLTNIGALILPAIILSLFVLIGNPIIVVVLLGLLGYRSRASFLTGLTVAQISEFSLILVSLGVAVGHVDSKLLSLVTLVGIITITGSTYMILYADFLYKKLKNVVDLFVWRKKPKRHKKGHDKTADVIIFGYDRVGYDFVAAAEKLGSPYLVVDFDPRAIKKMEAKEIPFKYGDAEDVEFLQEIAVTEAKMVVSTVPDFKANLLLVKYYRQRNSKGIIMAISHDIAQAQELYLAGASYVIMPHYLGAHHASQLIKKHGFDLAEFEAERNKHLTKLAKRE